MARIRLELKGNRRLVSDDMTAAEADAALRDEVGKKVGTVASIILPGVTALGTEVVGAQKIAASSRSVRLS